MTTVVANYGASGSLGAQYALAKRFGLFGELGLSSDAIPGGGHLNSDAGYRPWPSALAWCLDERTRLEGNESWGAG